MHTRDLLKKVKGIQPASDRIELLDVKRPFAVRGTYASIFHGFNGSPGTRFKTRFTWRLLEAVLIRVARHG